MKYPKVSDNPEIQSLYEEIRRGGESHKLAEMLALRQVPNLQTDTRWLAGMKDTGHGHAFYSHQMQRPISSKSDVRRWCEETGGGCEDLGIEPRPPEEDPWSKPYRVADSIVEREVERIEEQEWGGRMPEQKRAAVKEELAVEMSGAQ